MLKMVCRDELEFIIVARRDSIMRININDLNSVEVLPLPRVKSVIAVEYDLKNHTLFWSDVNRDRIMRLRLDAPNQPELLISTGIKSVEGLAFDWITRNLYFSDGAEGKIEVIHPDSTTFGRQRKVVVNHKVVDKPRGLAVHPVNG